jgi:GT2 family glycosyltransferase
MPGFAFMLTRDAIKEVGLFNTDFKVWYGDTDYEERLKEAGKRLNIPPLAVLNNTYVYHFGGSSYKYDKDRAAQQAIIKDQELFNSTHPYVEKRK